MKYLLSHLTIISLILFSSNSHAATIFPFPANINNNNNLYDFYTFVNNGECGLNIPILDFACEDLSIDISTESGNMAEDVFLSEVRLIIEHTWDNDLDISLTSPAGQTIDISIDNGGNGNNYGDFSSICDSYTAFPSNNLGNECNLTSITLGNPPFIGSYLPQQNLSTFTNGTANGIWTLTVCDDEEGDIGTIQYVELLFETTNCVVPSFVYSTELDSTSIILDWESGPNCASSQIEYGASGFTPGMGLGTIISATCPPFQIANLSPSSDYDFYIQEACASGGYTDLSCVFSTTTLCSPSFSSLYEDFETQIECESDCREDCDISGNWFNVSADETDWIVFSENTPTPDTGPNEDADGDLNGKYIYLETSCNGGFGWEAELYSNCIDILAEEGDCHMSFYYMMNGITVNNLKLEGTTDGIVWTPLWETTGNKGEIWIRNYIDLSAFNGETMQFRFSSKKLSYSTKGDVAIDNIAFHGPILAGEPAFTYYVDFDNDNYGLDDSSIQSCFSSPPPNFADQGGDCNDFISFINPGAVEGPCDGFDQNCNPLDDNDLPPPPGVGASVCSGETAPLYASSAYFGSVYWYDAPDLLIPIHIGNTFVPPSVENTTSDPIIITYYAVDIAFPGCSSAVGAEIDFIINPTPQTDQSYNEDICLGADLDLSNYPFIDENQTDYTLSYHTSLPANTSNELPSPIVSPSQNSVYFIVATTNEGCFDAIPFSVSILSTPQPNIIGSSEMCTGTSQILSVEDAGTNDAPYQYFWFTTGDTLDHTEIFAPSTAATESHIVALTGANGCTSLDSIEIVISNNLEPIAVTTFDVTNCLGNDGKIELSPNINIPSYNCSWEGVSSGSETINSNNIVIDNLEQGAYSITLTDDSGGSSCIAIIPFAVVNGPGAIVELDALENISCAGDINGSISLSVFGDNPTFEWDNGETTEDLNNLNIGDYSLTVTDGDCQNILNFSISEPEPLFIKPANISNVTCAENNDGAIDLILLGGTPPYSLEWNTGQTNSNIQNLAAGQYIVTLTDSHSCSLIDTFEILTPDETQIELLLKVNISCYGETDGLIKINATGGTEPYSYNWSNGSTLENISNIPSGAYSLTITDFIGCTAEMNNINIIEPEPLSIVDTLTISQDPNCFGSDSGIIHIEMRGGTPFVDNNGNDYYQYNWSNGATTATVLNLLAGEHNVTVTDSRNCTFTHTFLLNGSIELEANFISEAASCYGLANGNIYLESINSSNTGPFSFEWQDGSTTENHENLTFGTYTVTVSDSDFCSVVKTVEVLAEQPIQTAVDINNPNCFGQETGQITLDVFGSIPPYQFDWSNNANTEEENLNLLGGFYSVTITTDNNCYKILDSIEIVEPELIIFDLVALDSVICSGTATGNIELEITGGAAPYQFTWNGNGSLQEDLYNVDAGQYTLNVTDQNLCSVSQTYEVYQAPPLIVTTDIPSDSGNGCEGIAVDSLHLLISGGKAEFDIFWNTGQTNATLYDVEPGDYYATVTDALGCTIEVYSKIDTETPPLEVYTMDTTIVQNCANNSNSTICIEIMGGQAPYSYLWDDASNGTTSAHSLCRTVTFGSHSVTVTDANTCIHVYDFTVNYVLPLNLYMDGEGIEHIDCFGAENGAICPTITGGQTPYSYQWSWQENQEEHTDETDCLENLIAGDYFLTVSDARGCQVSGHWDISEPASLTSYEVDTIIHVTCFGETTGLIDLSFAGGSPPYNFEWANGETSEDIQDLSAGMYELTITDSKNCVRIIDSLSLEVTEPETALFENDVETIMPLCFDENGFVSLEILGGTYPYFYNWSQNNTPDESEVNLPDGNHSCTVTDANGCEIIVENITLNQPEELIVDLTIDPDVYGSVSVEVSGGTPFEEGDYSIVWSNGNMGTMATGYETGSHSVTITDENGCQKANGFIINPSAIHTTSIVENYDLFPNPTTGRATFTLNLKETSNTRIEIYNILGQKIMSESKPNFRSGIYELDFSGMAAGTYFLSLFVDGEFGGSLRILAE